MLQRILVADYRFPDDRVLRWGLRSPVCAWGREWHVPGWAGCWRRGLGAGAASRSACRESPARWRGWEARGVGMCEGSDLLPPRPPPPCRSESAKDLIRRMLVPHPSLRLPLTVRACLRLPPRSPLGCACPCAHPAMSARTGAGAVASSLRVHAAGCKVRVPKPAPRAKHPAVRPAAPPACLIAGDLEPPVVPGGAAPRGPCLQRPAGGGGRGWVGGVGGVGGWAWGWGWGERGGLGWIPLHSSALPRPPPLLQESRANQLAPEVLEEARQIVREASRQSPALAAPVQQQHLDALQQQQQQQQQQQRPPSREGAWCGALRQLGVTRCNM